MLIEIWADVVCPWCYIGKRRFERALDRFEQRDAVQLAYRSFELDPGAPPVVETSLSAMLSEKYGVPIEQARQMNERVERLAAAEGLEYRLDRARPGNSFDAHRLVHLAGEAELDGAMVERLYRAYFGEGRAIGERSTLVELAAETGLAADDVEALLGSDRYAAEVRADEQLAAQLGIRGVPFFAIDRRYGVSGAQEADTLLAALETAWRDRAPAPAGDALAG
jgi:predicted DsbA family dithiol-disulfide isomerase